MRTIHYTSTEGEMSPASPQEDLEESKEVDPDAYEERFRVDRRKLEQMLQGGCENDKQKAEDFFIKVMEDTDTQITWPSKLKIGAKSKKDPHIKVAGKPEDVRRARELIMAVLDTKSNRVTLKMDVSHTEHSHVIGKGGNNIKRVMADTGCHIHFPDSNRGTQGEKSNQVSIAGKPLGVEQARAAIRELLPLVFLFELPITGVLQPVPDSNSPIVQRIQQTFNVTVTFKQRPRLYFTTVIVRGSVNNANGVKEATLSLMEHLTGNIGVMGNISVNMQLEIAPQHHLFMMGRGGINIKQIMQKTGATVHFPDPNTATPQRKGTVYITGGIDSVFLARQQLIGCLPLVLMFDMKEEVEIDQGTITQLMEQLDIFISVKPKPKQPSKSVIVKSIERNAGNMYEARRILLGLDRDDRTVPSLIPTSHMPVNGLNPSVNTLGLTNLGLLAPNVLSVSTGPQRSLGLNEHNSSPPSSNGSNSPHQWISSPTSLYSPMMMLSPVTTVPTTPYEQLVYANCNGLHKDFNQNDPQVKLTLQHSNAVLAATSSPSYVDPPTLVSHNSNTPSPIDLISSASVMPPPTINGIAPPNMIPTPTILPGTSMDDLEVHTMRAGSTYVNVVVPKSRSPSSSGSSVDLKGLNKPQSPLVMLEHDVRSAPFQNGDRQSSESGGESDSSEKRPPGADRPKPPPGFPSQPANPPISFDYEQKKLLATKAIQKKPGGETRNPTDYWSGLGFSKSMPDTVIRDRLKQNNIRYTGPTMTTTYEASSLEEEDGVDRDPWKNSKKLTSVIPPKPEGDFSVQPPGLNSFNGLCSGLNSTSLVDSGSKSIWSAKSDLCELFSKLGLGKYTDLFQQQEIDLSTFITLTDEDLKELGISTFGARRKMLLAITDLNKRRSHFSATPGANNPFRNPNPVLAAVRRQDIASHSGRW